MKKAGELGEAELRWLLERAREGQDRAAPAASATPATPATPLPECA